MSGTEPCSSVRPGIAGAYAESETVTVPLHIEDDPDEVGAASVFIDVDVTGTPRRFLFDTGAARGRIAMDAAASFDQTPSATPGRGALGAARPQRRTRVPFLRIGTGPSALHADDVVMEVASAADPGPPDILGQEVIAGHRWDVRFPTRTLTIDADAEDADADERPLVLSSAGHPHVDVTWDAVTALAVWDSGAGVTVVDAAFASRHPTLFTPLRNSRGHDAHGITADTAMVTMAACVVGERRFAPSLAALAPIAGIQPPGEPAFDLIIGYPLLAQADWRIDLQQGTWSFLPR